MEVYLFLFNNLSFTFPQCFSDSNFAKNYSIHDNIVLAFSDEHILDSIVLLSQQKFKGENVKIALLLMEIIFNVLNLESNKLNFSQKINKLSKLREKEQFKNKNIKNRSSNWNSQFVLSKNVFLEIVKILF
ncbi:hypothetical protein MHBO_004040 [Bonamia ostreae]|uniref:Timeless N-terminal domain-containing protein n=1 Tax=Bonamia ostreae TaxID=126728 RepID=A0ABV2ASW4_9EUKA